MWKAAHRLHLGLLFHKYNDTITAKSLRRMAVAVRQLAEDDALELYDPESLRAKTEALWLTGIAVLDADGKSLCEYSDGRHHRS